MWPLPALGSLLAAAGMRSEYQLLKRQVLEVLPVSKDAVHMYIGIGCLLISIFALRMPPAAWRSLLLGLLASIVMEALDLRDNVRYPATVRAVEAVHDLINTNLAAFAFVLTMRLRYGKPEVKRKPAKAKK
jgi:uncharacterized membrane protein SirB2